MSAGDVRHARARGDVTASVVIANHNYGHYLAQAIESALGQSAPGTEVIVVDDGSTDGSREVIAAFGAEVTAVLQENAGQVAAFNAGFAASRGEVVVFLDADDLLEEHALATALPAFAERRVAKAHWPLTVVDEHGVATGDLLPGETLSDGDLLHAMVARGPGADVSPPTSGNAWRRAALERVYPFSGVGDRHGGDAYLHTVVPLYGSVARIDAPLSRYRVHSANRQRRNYHARLKRDLRRFEARVALLSTHLRRLGIGHDPARWTAPGSAYAWLRTLDQAADEIEAAVPPGGRYLLVDDQQWSDPWLAGALTPGRAAVPFPERDGLYWGPPSSGAHAVAELARMRREGVGYLVLAAPCFWWLDHYGEFREHLDRHCRLAFRSATTVVYDIGR